MTEISFECGHDDRKLIEKIAVRYCKIFNISRDDEEREQVEMSLTAYHCNDSKLDLKRLLKADNFNLIHDVRGIHNNVSRTTGKIIRGRHFLPRFCLKTQEV